MIINSFVFGGAPPAITATWNSAVVSAPAVLTTSDLRLTASVVPAGTYANTRSTRALSGKSYISAVVSLNAVGSQLAFGVGDATTDMTNASVYAGDSTASMGAWSAGNVFFGASNIGSIGAFDTPDYIQIAVDTATRQVWVRRNGGAWLGGGDPAAGTTPTVTLSGSGLIYALGSLTKSLATSTRYVQIAPDAAATTGSVPSGFTAANWVP